MEQPLVSVITYCFNGERFVHKYFDALLAQTYPNVELFFYNNGSADRTGEIAESYRTRLMDKGWTVNIEHFADNQVTCSLKQDALRRMHGVFFCGCDSDDVMYPEHISHMVQALLQQPDKGIVFCKLNVVQEETGESRGTMQVKPQTVSKGAFLDCLMARNMIYTPIGSLTRTVAFDAVVPNRTIHQTQFGENYQMLLPLLYHDQSCCLDEVLGDYLVRGDSYTGKLVGQRQVDAFIAQEETIRATLDLFHPAEEATYLLMAQRRLRTERLFAALALGDAAQIKAAKQACRAVGALNCKLRLTSCRPLYALRKAVQSRKDTHNKRR